MRGEQNQEIPPALRTRRSRTRLFRAVLTIVAASLIISHLLTRKHPQEERWEQALESSSFPLSAGEELPPAVDVIVEAGPEAIPFLLGKVEGSFAERTLEKHWDDLPEMLRSRLTQPKFPYRNDLPRLLEKIGPEAKPALPRMRRIFLANPEGQLNLFNAIGTIGRNDPATFDFLVSAGRDQKMSRFVRGNATHYLGFWSPSEEVVDALIQLYHDPDPDVTQYACTALGRQGPAAKKAFPLLKAAVTNLHPMVRSTALKSLRLIDTNGTQAIPILQEIVKHSDPEFSALADHELQKFGVTNAAP